MNFGVLTCVLEHRLPYAVLTAEFYRLLLNGSIWVCSALSDSGSSVCAWERTICTYHEHLSAVRHCGKELVLVGLTPTFRTRRTVTSCVTLGKFLISPSLCFLWGIYEMDIITVLSLWELCWALKWYMESSQPGAWHLVNVQCFPLLSVINLEPYFEE